MIRAKIYRDQDGRISEFDVYGHASFDEYGKDIVCSAASMFVQAAIVGLQEHLGLVMDVKKSSGKLHCIMPNVEDANVRIGADAILETMVLGLKCIAMDYGDNLKIIDVNMEVK